MSDCKARRINDQMFCDGCGVQWDLDDTDPPVCRADQPEPKPRKPTRAGNWKGATPWRR